MVTVSNDVEIAVQAIEAGAYDFVVKPIHFPQLLISAQRAFKFNHLSAENKTLRETLDMSKGVHPEGIIGKSESIHRIIDLAKRVAKSSSTVSISGESGTGKEILPAPFITGVLAARNLLLPSTVRPFRKIF